MPLGPGEAKAFLTNAIRFGAAIGVLVLKPSEEPKVSRRLSVDSIPLLFVETCRSTSTQDTEPEMAQLQRSETLVDGAARASRNIPLLRSC
jgi:hypothetical protein